MRINQYYKISKMKFSYIVICFLKRLKDPSSKLDKSQKRLQKFFKIHNRIIEGKPSTKQNWMQQEMLQTYGSTAAGCCSASFLAFCSS